MDHVIPCVGTGSSSMASVCGASLALFDAGVPMTTATGMWSDNSVRIPWQRQFSKLQDTN